jgi:hypothetical protein
MTRPYKKLTRKLLREYLYLDGEEWYWRVRQGKMAAGSKAGHLRANGTYIIRLFEKGYAPQGLKYFLEKGYWPKRSQRRQRCVASDDIEISNAISAAIERDTGHSIHCSIHPDEDF